MRWGSVTKNAFFSWQKDQATVWCAALAYYTVFSVGPLLLLIISLLGLFVSTQTIEKNIYIQLQSLVGSTGVNFLLTVVHHAKHTNANIISSIIGFITLLLGATGVFGQLQQMLNAVWGVTQQPRAGIMHLLTDRILNFSMVGVIAFLLLVSLVASTTTANLGSSFRFLPQSTLLLETINVVLSFLITSALFAIVLKVLPDVKIRWRDVWTGAICTALLFTIGKTIIGMYIARSGVTSEYGAAASLIVLLLWVYYSSQILFFGAEFTKADYLSRGREVIPSENAMLKRVKEKVKTGSKNFIEEAAAGFVEGAMNEAVKEVHEATAQKKKQTKKRGK